MDFGEFGMLLHNYVEITTKKSICTEISVNSPN